MRDQVVQQQDRALGHLACDNVFAQVAFQRLDHFVFRQLHIPFFCDFKKGRRRERQVRGNGLLFDFLSCELLCRPFRSTHQVPPTQQVCLAARPVRWPPRTTCMQPFLTLASRSGIHAVNCNVVQQDSSRLMMGKERKLLMAKTAVGVQMRQRKLTRQYPDATALWLALDSGSREREER